MEWLILAALVIIIIVAIAILKNLQTLNKTLAKDVENQNILYGKLEEIHGEVKKKGGVTDPVVAANKTHTLAASTKHIIVRKSPDQIRAENYEKIKNGTAKYGEPE